MNQRQADFLAKIGGMSRGIIDRAFKGAASPRQAIKAKCLDCCHFDRDEVENCTVVLCPLHAYRPYAQKSTLAPASSPSEAEPCCNAES